MDTYSLLEQVMTSLKTKLDSAYSITRRSAALGSVFKGEDGRLYDIETKRPFVCVVTDAITIDPSMGHAAISLALDGQANALVNKLKDKVVGKELIMLNTPNGWADSNEKGVTTQMWVDYVESA